MEQFLFDFLGSASGPVAYALVFGVLLACGLGFPLPEDVALITGGYLVFKGNATLPVMMAVGFAGILAGDSLVFSLGRMGRRARGRFTGGLLARHLTPERIAKVEAQFEKRGPIMVMIARFLPGIRAATYFVAGGAKMSYVRFIAYDGLAALLSAPVFVLAGVYFGEQIGHLIEWAEQFHYWLIGAIVAALAIFVARAVWRGRKDEVAGPPQKAGDPSANGLARLPAESVPLRVSADKPALASEEKGRATG
ncbi:MAG TPA: DedA family protein [Vulgatibacter sp.]|nr:DedA family protein [Vulgatibacter sp.]